MPCTRTRAGAAALVLSAFLAFVAAGCASSSSIGAATDDTTISTHVKTALLNDPQINATAINVATADGVVTISGTVRSIEEEQRAVALARRIQGVKDVRSALQVNPGATPQP